jgi:transposase InsO family protein
MNSHENARLTAKGRARLLARITEVGIGVGAAESGISVRTAYKWRARFEQQGEVGLRDRSSRPLRVRSALSSEERDRALALRTDRRPIREIAEILKRPYTTVRRYLAQNGLSRLPALQAPPPVVRYEREQPGEMLHLDTKKLGRIEKTGHRVTGDRRDHTRGAGWEVLHLAVDDHSRLAYTEVLPDEQRQTTTDFLARALAWFADHGVTVERVMTDNGSAYRSKLFAAELRSRGITHRFTRPYTPRTNGKAERFVQTALREWAYAYAYRHSSERTQQLAYWQHHYNHHRRHSIEDHAQAVVRQDGDGLDTPHGTRSLGLHILRSRRVYALPSEHGRVLLVRQRPRAGLLDVLPPPQQTAGLHALSARARAPCNNYATHQFGDVDRIYCGQLL